MQDVWVTLLSAVAQTKVTKVHLERYRAQKERTMIPWRVILTHMGSVFYGAYNQALPCTKQALRLCQHHKFSKAPGSWSVRLKITSWPRFKLPREPGRQHGGLVLMMTVRRDESLECF